MKTILSAAMIAALASTGLAQLTPGGQPSVTLSPQAAQATPISLGGQINSVNQQFAGTGAGPSGYFAFNPGNGPVGFDDYATVGSDVVDVATVAFVGGVADVGGTIGFEFYDATGATLLGSFNVALPQAGNFIWTITLDPGTVLADPVGIVQCVVDAGTTGQFFLSDGEPTIGTQSNTFGGANGGVLRHCFSIGGHLPTQSGAYCFGDGLDQACPCANDATSGGTGCVNSTGAGAALTASGDATVGADSFVLSASGLPAGKTVLFFQGNSTTAGGAGAGLPFGDGLRCAAGGIRRLQTTAADGSGVAVSSVSLSVAGGVATGDVRSYQCWYRDVAGPCGSGSNTTNAYLQTWN